MPPDPTENTITVTGQAVVHAVPDETRFRIMLTAVRPAAEEALEEVTIRSHRLDALLSELGIEQEKRATTGVSLREKRRWFDEPTPEGTHRERSVLEGYEAHGALVVRLQDPSLAGRLIQRAVEEIEASIDGPYWHVDTDNPAHLEAFREAARDAERKAQTYAEAFDVELGPIRSIHAPSGGQPGGYVLSGGARALAAEPIGLDANIELSAGVTVTYEIRHER
jgi:uncharacterized protein